MTQDQLQKKARTLFADETTQQKWVRSVLQLGEKWLLATPVQRKSTPKREVEHAAA